MEFLRVFYTGLCVSDTHIKLKETMRFASSAAWCRDNGHPAAARKAALISGRILRDPGHAFTD